MMKLAAAAVALLALASTAQADPITVQTKSLHQRGAFSIEPSFPSLSDPFFPVLFEPFDFGSGTLNDATLRITATYTPFIFNESSNPPATLTLTTGLCLFFPVWPCISTVEPGVLAGPGWVGAPITIDRTFDVTDRILAGKDFGLTYFFVTTPRDMPGVSFDATTYSGWATLTYYDDPLPVPEPTPVGIMALALLSVGLIRRRC